MQKMTNTLKTPFGVFAGHKGDNVIQYRGIKYASVKDQIAVPELVINYGDAIIDATHFGSVTYPSYSCALLTY